MPIEHYIGRLSEEFGGALPSVIERELARWPPGFLEQVIEYRAYAATKDVVKQIDAKGKRQPSEMEGLVREIEMELAAEAMGIEFRPNG